MAIFNSWITPLQRSYQSIKSKILESLRTRVPEMTDVSEGNIFVIIISTFSAIAEVLHYYIDNTAREAFLISSRRLSSVYKHAKAVDYHMKAANPSSVDLTVYKTDDTPISTNLLIPANTLFTSKDGKKWVSTTTVNWRTGSYSVNIPVAQKEPSLKDIELAVIEGPGMEIKIGNIPSNKQYAEGTMIIKLNGVIWELVDTFAFSGPSDKVFKVELDEELEPVIVFGDNNFGKYPNLGETVTANYYITEGSMGNIGTEMFSSVPNLISSIEIKAAITNSIASSGGTDYDDFETIKRNIPLSIKTLGVAITKDDWEALVKLVPGVNKSYVNYICGRFVEIYITPIQGTEASMALINSVKNTLTKSKVITTSISVKSTKPSYIILHATIYGRRSFSKIDIENQVRKALISEYNENYSEINQPVRLSNIYSLVENQSTVDYLTVDKLYFMPLVYPVGEGKPLLNIANFEQLSFQALSNKITFERITLKIESTTKYKVTLFNGNEKTYNFNTNENIKTVYSEFVMNLSKTDITYNVGDLYVMVIQKMDKDLIPYDYTLPLLTSPNLKLTIHEKV